jgi:hypothetical protein
MILIYRDHCFFEENMKVRFSNFIKLITKRDLIVQKKIYNSVKAVPMTTEQHVAVRPLPVSKPCLQNVKEPSI